MIALGHDLGCGLAEGTTGDDILRRTLRGYATHPNIVGVLVVSLGCEVNQPENIFGSGMDGIEHLMIQGLGGTVPTVNEGLRRIAEMVGRGEHVAPGADPGIGVGAGPAVWRQRRVLRTDRQPDPGRRR